MSNAESPPELRILRFPSSEPPPRILKLSREIAQQLLGQEMHRKGQEMLHIYHPDDLD